MHEDSIILHRKPCHKACNGLSGETQPATLYTELRKQDSETMPDLKFGASGLRGPVSHLIDDICQRYMTAFLRHMATVYALQPGPVLVPGNDLRASRSPQIVRAVIQAALAAGYCVEMRGALPTPALALVALTEHACAVMVAGSHIPEDRNGLKFYRHDGEIDKADEAGIFFTG